MNKPKVRVKGYEEEWEQHKLGEVLSSLKNNTLSRAELSVGEGVAKNIHYGDILVKFGELLEVRDEQLPMIKDDTIVAKYKASFLQNGDVIIADTAEDETVGKCTEIAGLDNETVISGLHTIPYRPLFKFASGYLGYYMNSAAYHSQLLPLMQGIKVTSISKSAMQNTDIVYPKSINEQEKIGSYFHNLNHLITLHQKKCEETKILKKYMLQKMFPQNGMNVPEVRFDGFTDAWEQRKLGEICSEIGDGLHSAPDYDENGEYFFINGNNLVNGKIVIKPTETKKVSEETFEKNDKCLDDSTILLSINGTIGNLAYYSGEKVMLGKSAAYLKVQNIDKTFLYTSLQTPIIMGNFMTSLTGTTIKNLGLDAIKNTRILIPNNKEQIKIGAYFTALDHLITLHQRKCNELQDIKKFMLQNMFV